MDRKGRFTLAFLIVAVSLALVAATLVGAQVREQSQERTLGYTPNSNSQVVYGAASKSPYQLGLTGDNKRPDGIPNEPAIVDAVFSAQGAGTADDVLYLVFNQDIASAALDSILFIFGGATGDTVITATDGLVFAYQTMATGFGQFNVIEVTGLDNLPIPLTTAHMVALPNPLDLPFACRNASRIPVKTGPAITNVVISRPTRDYVTDPVGVDIFVYFTHRITAGVSAADARVDFTFPEAGTAGAPPTSSHTPDDNFIVIEMTDNDTQGAVREGISAVRLAGANVLSGRIDDGAGSATGPTELSSEPRWHCSLNEGPVLLRASYNAALSTITLVYSDDIDVASVSTPGAADYILDAGATYASVASNDGDNVLTLIGVAGGPPTTVTMAAATIVADYQGNNSGSPFIAPLAAPPIIILANHDDNGTDALNDDRITAWFDVDFSAAPAIGNFSFRGFDGTGATTALPASGNQIQIIDLNDAWEQGDRIFLTDGVSITYDGGVNAAPDTSHAWIRDGSAPRFVGLATNGTLTADINDVAFVGVDEFGPQDDAAYALIYSRRVIESQPDFDFKTQNQNNAAVLIDPSAGLQGIDLNIDLAVACAIDTMSTDSAGDTLNAGDDVFFWGVTVDKEGNWDPTNCYLLGSLVAGPLACPRDTLVSDNDAIHVYGVSPTSEGPYTEETHFICGDENSAPTDADSVRVYADMGRVNLLGSAVVNADGSWGPIEMANPLGTTVPVVWVVSVQNTGASAVESFDICPIINDNLEPTIASVEDPTNALKCYSGGDTLRLLIDVNDPATPDGIFLNPTAKNALMHVWVDLTEYVTTAGADSVVLVSLGANREDDDNDWIDASANPTFAGNGVRDYPEPFVDEDGNGAYTPGETFIDISGAGYTDGVYDVGDTNLDSNDPEEMGMYYLPGYYIDPADMVADPNGSVNFAVLEDIPVVINIEDNAARSDVDDNLNNGGDFAAQMSAISDGKGNWVDPFNATCPSFSLEHRIVDNTTCLGRLDAQAPTVSEISFLERQSSLTDPSGNPGDNIIIPGDHVYTVAAGEAGSYINLADSTLSDDDVQLIALQIDNGSGWEYLSFDPAGDANSDGAPGILDYDDDEDYAGGDVNEDGVVDDLDGVDLGDEQVTDAMQDSTADANAVAGDGIYRTTDRRDNDNDAFFRYNPIYGTYLWFNIDENTTNDIDDNGNGTIDDGAEAEGYTAANDDDEDGIEDATAVRIDMRSDQFIQTTGAGAAPISLWVGGFEDPATVASYAGTPAGSRADYLENTSAVSSWPNNVVTVGTLLTSGALDFYPNPYEILSNVLNGADDVAALAKGANNMATSGGWDDGAVFDPSTVTNAGFDYRATNGFNLNMRVIKSNYGLVDGVEFQMRGVAFDACFQGNPNWAVPIRLATDSGVADADIPADTFDNEPVCDVILTDNDNDGFLDAATYTLEAVISGDVADIASVDFQRWNETTEMWDVVGTDISSPFTFDYTHPNAPLANDPPDDRDTCYFRAIATDQFGNIEDDVLCDSLFTMPGGDPCFELEMIIEDCTPPMSCICQVGTDYDPSDGALVPAESAVDISAWFTDGDGDSTTNDVRRVLFEYRPVGTDTWLTLESLTGVPAPGDSLVDVTGIKHHVIATGPDTLKVTVTWDTRNLPTGTYDIRAVAFDIEGNNNANMACVYSVTVDNIGLRAYIQPCLTIDQFTQRLYGNVYIHDVAVSTVTFEFYEDTDGNGIDDDGSSWIPIEVIGDDERKGDVILRAGTGAEDDAAGGTYRDLSASVYVFYDVDEDGYNPVDPVYIDSGTTGGVVDASDVLVIDTGINTNDILGEDLSAFASDEYYTDINGDNTLDTEDWILKNNPLNGGGDAIVDFWVTDWDVTGLSGCYITRAVAVDQLGNTDDDGDGDGVPDSDPTEIWTEQCCIDTDIPVFCVTAYIPAIGGPEVAIPAGPECPWVGAQDSLIFIATELGGGMTADIDSVQFEYSTDGGATWTWFATDFFGPDWQGVFDYADFNLITDTAFNFRAKGYKNDGVTALDPNQCKACLVLGENQGPETDIVMAITAEGDTLETNTVLRGNIEPLCLEPTSLYMLVTAEDNATIDSVWFMHRKIAGTSPADTTEWLKVLAGISPTADDTYPYEFNWDLSTLTDGVYEFFPRAIDTNGNVTATFGNPFVLSISTQTADVTGAEKIGIPATDLIPGEEVVVFAELTPDPSDNLGVTVNFWYAERIEGEELEVSPVQPHTADTDFTIYSNSMAGEHGSETVFVAGVEATFHEMADFLALGAPTALDYTIYDSNTLRFGAAPADGDTVTINYNVTECSPINTGDNDSPYTVAWDADSPNGLVPAKTYDEVTHYDLIATVSRTFIDNEGTFTASCDEECHSDGFALPIADTEAPDFIIAGLLCEEDPQNAPGSGITGLASNYPDAIFNATGNPLCQTCGGTDVSGPFGSCKCKLSGIEHQVFVIGDNDPDTDEIDVVEMSVGGDPGVSFDLYTAEDDSTITIPITFYIDDLANVTANGFSTKAVNPDSVENVTINMPSAGIFNAEMTDMGDGVYWYDAVLEIPETSGSLNTYDYSFSVDLVGDDQVEMIADPRWDTSQILIPAEFWCYSILDPATFWGVNELDQVGFEVSDAEGNMSTHLTSGGHRGAAGQIWVTYDPTPAVVRSIWMDTVDRVRSSGITPGVTGLASTDITVGVNGTFFIDVEIGDVVPATADIINLEGIIIQVAVDDTRERWRTISDDFLNYAINGARTESGGWGGEVDLPSWMNPAKDGIDNDRDGLTDDQDPDEQVYTYGLRIVTIDDCYNYGYSCGHPRAQSPEVCGTITVDAELPQACIIDPVDGQIVNIGDTIELVAQSDDDDLDYVLFQYSLDSGNSWNDIDCTPLNDDDDPWVPMELAESGGIFTCPWDTEFLAGFLAGDMYVSLRACAVDKAGNEGCEDNELDCNVNIILNDVTGPMAAITLFEYCEDDKRLFDPTLALSGDVNVVGRATGWNGADVATVVLQLSTDGVSFETIGVDQEMQAIGAEIGARWEILWETDDYAEGTYFLRVYATDADGNVQNDSDGDGTPEDLIAVEVRVDHTAPDADLVRVGGEGINGTTLEDGDIIRSDNWASEVEMCFNLNEQITFQAEATDVDGDVEFIDAVSLQWLDDVTNAEDPEWRTICQDFDYRDFPGNDLNPDGKWVLVYENISELAEDMSLSAGLGSNEYNLPAKEYRFRVRGVDYACNINEDNVGIVLRLDHVEPEIRDIFAGDTTFEGGAGGIGNTVHVAGGDIVPLAAFVRDVFALTVTDGLDNDGDRSWNHETSGMFAVQFGYYDGDGNHNIIGLGTYDDNGTPGDGPKEVNDDLWRIDWETPMNMAGTTDTLYTIVVTVRDNVNDCVDRDAPDLVDVQDVTPPEDSKLIAVAGDFCSPGRGTVYPFTDLNEDDGPLDGLQGIDEAVLSQDFTGTQPLGTVSRTVDLYIATPAGDASMLSGFAFPGITQAAGELDDDDDGPFFNTTQARIVIEGRRVDNGAPGDWIAIGDAECRYNCGMEYFPENETGVTGTAAYYQGPIFTTSWNTLAQYPNGDYIWYDDNADGNSVQIRLKAVDVWGNEETITDDHIYHLIVDNTAPTGTVSVHNPPDFEIITEAERNNPDGVLLLADAGEPGVFVNDDLVISFYYKLASDLDDDASWIFIDEDNGFDPTNDNPDYTRPYSFHWDTNSHRDDDGEPLIPNEDYDIAIEVSDLVCNTTEVVNATKRGDHTTFKFVDTIAPQATIVELNRDLDGAYCELDNDTVENPEGQRVNGVDDLVARILDGSTDVQDVLFYYRAAGTSEWTLADGDVTVKDLGEGDGDGDALRDWYLSNWSSAPLAEGAWEFAAVATDDAGNTDADPPVLTLIIDRTGPEFAALDPVDGQIIVPENYYSDDQFNQSAFDECDPDERIADIIVTSADADILYETSWDNCVEFEWKYSNEEDTDNEFDDTNWVSFDGMVLYDGATGRYSTTIDMYGSNAPNDGLVDWRVIGTDHAGNTTYTTFAEATVVDNSDPTLEITHFNVDGDVDTTIDPIDNGQITDVSHGEQIRIYATVSDDEVDIPADVETDVVEVQFFVRHASGSGDGSNDWIPLGTAGYDEALGLWSVLWNTTGLTSTGSDVDTYEITAYATDEAANCGEAHEWITVHVTNQAVPLAQVSAFNPDLLSVITKGTNDYVYGLTFGEKEASTVFFQYRPVGTTEWTTLGVGEYTGETLTTRQASLIDQDLWNAGIRTSDWEEGSVLEFRAVATNEIDYTDAPGIVGAAVATKPNANGGLSPKNRVPGQGGVSLLDGETDIFSGLYDLENTPILRMEVARKFDGSTQLKPADDLGYLLSLDAYMTDTVVNGRIDLVTSDATLAPFVVVVAEDGDGDIDEFIPEMERKADNTAAWGAELFNSSSTLSSVDPTEGAILTVYASAHLKRTSPEDPAPRTEMSYVQLIYHQITQNLGSNGVLGVDGMGAAAADGYPTDDFAVEVLPGAYDAEYGMLLARTEMPLTPEDTDRYIETIGTAYRTSLHSSTFGYSCQSIRNGLEHRVWIRYDEADLEHADGTFDESKLEVRYWTGSDWSRSGITNIVVDTEANVVSFRTDESCATYAIVATDETAPITMNFSPNWAGWTDQDPIIRGQISSPGESIDMGSFELTVDGELVFSTAGETSECDNDDFGDGFFDDDWYFMYPGSDFCWQYIDEEHDRVGFEYRHTCSNNDALVTGTHTVSVSFETDNSEARYGDGVEFEFMVDRNAPYIEFHGGYVGNPSLDFAAGYIDLEQDILTVKLYDGESGIQFREDRIDDYIGVDDACDEFASGDLCELIQEYLPGSDLNCYGEDHGDHGFKFDVWVIDNEDDQLDIDEFEERTLIYTGTADAVAPYVTPSLSEYTPGDTLTVPLAVLTGGELIEDGSVIEITIYSHKLIMVGGEPTAQGDLGALLDQLDSMGMNVKFDVLGQEYQVYTRGVQDCVYNAGSRFVEQRFIVDSSAPDFTPTSAGVACGAGATGTAVAQTDSYTFTGVFEDSGSGVDASTVSVNVSGPGDIVVSDLNVTGNGLSFNVSNNAEGSKLALGNYIVTVTGSDRLGNEFTFVCTFTVGSSVVQVDGAKVFPNPFNPGAGDAMVNFTLPKAADVTVRAYDFAGAFVTEIFNGSLGVGEHSIPWGGQAEDGTALANGVYLVRIVADDGSRQEPRIVKVALWNER